MRIKPLLEAKAELTHGNVSKCPIVLSTRIRLARNLAGYSFPGWASLDQRKEILAGCFESAGDVTSLKRGLRFDIGELTDLEKKILFERHLISRELISGKNGAGVIIGKDQSCVVMVNEEDHLRIQVLRSGFHFNRVWRAIDRIDSAIEEKLPYAYSPQLGYLTACPTNLGTGMRASAMMHLPGLVISNQMEKVIRAVNQLGIAVRGLFGEGSDASGSIFQISNQMTLGESERQIIKRLSGVLESVIEQENNARERLFEKQPVKLRDKIARAYGILRTSHLISSSEAMNLLSLIRFGLDRAIFDEEHRDLLDRLMIECQPGHIQYSAKHLAESEERDVLRAAYLRREFEKIPEPDFDNNRRKRTRKD